MSRYFFHLTSGHEILDSEGTELESLPVARCHAVKMIAEVLCGSPEMYWEHECYRVTVADETGLTLFTVEMMSTDAAALRGSPRYTAPSRDARMSEPGNQAQKLLPPSSRE